MRFSDDYDPTLPGVHVFVDLLLEFSENFRVDVEEHSDSEEQLVVMSVKMFPVAFVKEHFGVKFLLLRP